MTIKGFTKADNSILFSSNISNNAKLVYIQIKYYSSLEGFRLSKRLILKDSQLSVNTFDKVIKELKNAGLVIQKVAKEGKRNIYWYITTDEEVKLKTNKPIEGEITVEEALGNSTCGIEKKEAIKQSKQNKIDNHINVRLVRKIVDIDKSKFDKEILSLANEELVRNTIKKFRKLSEKKREKSFFSAKTIRNILIQEYYSNKMNFPSVMLKKINAVEEIPLKQYSELAEDIEMNMLLEQFENEFYVIGA